MRRVDFTLIALLAMIGPPEKSMLAIGTRVETNGRRLNDTPGRKGTVVKRPPELEGFRPWAAAVQFDDGTLVLMNEDHIREIV